MAAAQSVTRRQWLTAKLGFAYALALVCGQMLSAAFTWWWQPHALPLLHQVRARVPILVDNAEGRSCLALLLFMTAAGITIGVLLRRLVPAMCAWPRLRRTAVSAFVRRGPGSGSAPPQMCSRVARGTAPCRGPLSTAYRG
ncbi:hypothetical protein SCYAM73S_07069 [Streptomyces cyaneofuscatus]